MAGGQAGASRLRTQATLREEPRSGDAWEAPAPAKRPGREGRGKITGRGTGHKRRSSASKGTLGALGAGSGGRRAEERNEVSERRAGSVPGKAWNLVNTALGVAFGLAGMPFGGGAPRPRDNALVFLEHPLMRWLPAAAVTLGNVVLYAPGYAPESPRPEGGSGTLADHEHQHTIQGEHLGPLYLPLVGLPSVLRVVYAAMYRARTGRRWSRYYDGWPENSADRLGGADRSLRPEP